MRRFKMFGLQRTGTNHVRWGLRQNFYAKSVEVGREWKHGPILASGRDLIDGHPICIVVCVRDPWAWLPSMYRWARTGQDEHASRSFSRKWDFATFLQRPHYEFASPMDRYNARYREYLDWLARHPGQGVLVHSEDLMPTAAAAREFKRIGDQLGLQRRHNVPLVSEWRIDALSRQTREAMDFAHYLERKYLSRYTDELQQLVSDALDETLLKELGYGREGRRGTEGLC